MLTSSKRLVAAAAVLAFVAAACGSDRDSSASTSTAPPSTAAAVSTPDAPTTGGLETTDSAEATTPSADAGTDSTTPSSESTDTTESATTVEAETTVPTTESDLPSFGDAPYPCGAGDGNNADDGSEPGVTKDAISIAGGDDAGYAGAPGLGHEMTDAMKAIVSKCNDLGGINGRTITFNYYDAAIFNAPTAMQAACDDGNFYLIGEGWSFDSNQEEARLGCNMPAVPGYAVSAAFSNGKDMVNAVPAPADQQNGAPYELMAQLFPEEVKSAGTLAGNFSATQESRDKVVAAAPTFGWNFLNSTLEYNVVGESDWTPFVKQLSDGGVKMFYWVGTCLPNLQQFAQTAIANGYDVPIFTDTNHYTKNCADANTDGALDNMYVQMTYVPLEEAADNKATQDYLDLMAEKGGDTAQLGEQAMSAFLLWATAAQQCGATLTRACVLDNLHAIHSWTGHGMHAETDPGSNTAGHCAAIVKLDGTKYVRVLPKEAGTFACDESWITPIDTPAVAAALLDANRISQQFGSGG